MAKGKTSKMDAVRQALDELGKDAKPLALQEHLKSKGISMSTNMISNYKTAHKKSRKRGRRRGRKPGRVAVVAAPAGRGSSLTLADIQAIKKLTDRMGADKLKELVTVLGG